MPDELVIGVSGLAEFNRALRQIEPAAQKEMRVALNDVAGLLVKKITPLIPTRTGRAARSLKARSTRTAARIAVGGKSAPYYPWLDFGGTTGPKRSVSRPFFKEGRYVYPTLRQERPAIMAALDEALTTVARNAGLDVD